VTTNTTLFNTADPERMREMFDAMHIRVPGAEQAAVGANPIDHLVALPEDLEAWVLAEAG